MQSASRVLCFMLCMLPALGFGHSASTGFLILDLNHAGSTLRIDIALRDLLYVTDPDRNADRAVTWGELLEQLPAIRTYVHKHLTVRAAAPGSCALIDGPFRLSDRANGTFAALTFDLRCDTAPTHLFYDLLFDIDTTHRGLIQVRDGSGSREHVMSPSQRNLSLQPGTTSATQLFRDFWREGVHHIWIGLDHILFLVTLLLPAALSYHAGCWHTRDKPRHVIIEAVTVVTAFTAAHSITLSLSAFDVVVLPTRLVESVIALTVILAAVNNIFPMIPGRRWVIAFVLGLIHGFGFAAVLSDLGLPTTNRVLTLAAFNLGVEAGQLAIVLLLLPIIYLLRNWRIYRDIAMPATSALIALIGCLWLAERSLNLELIRL